MSKETPGQVTITPNPNSVYFETLAGYLKMGNVDLAFEQAYGLIQDGRLTFVEWLIFLKQAKTELTLAARRESVLRG